MDYSDSSEIFKSILSTIGFCAKNKDRIFFETEALEMIVKLIKNIDQDISDSGRVILENYLSNNNFFLQEKILDFLAALAVEQHCKINASFIIKSILDNNKSISLSLKAKYCISEGLNDTKDVETLINLTSILQQESNKEVFE